MALSHDWVAIRDKYKGQTVSSGIRRFFGAYSATSGSLERLNVAVDAYSRAPNEANLITVHQCIEDIARSEKVQKYGLALAELLMRLPRRPARMGLSKVANDLLSYFSEVQASAATRVFSIDPTPLTGRAPRAPIEVRWKKGAITSLTETMNNWSGELKEVAAYRAAQGDVEAQHAMDVMQDQGAVRELAGSVFGVFDQAHREADRTAPLDVRLAAQRAHNVWYEQQEQRDRQDHRDAMVSTYEVEQLLASLRPVGIGSDRTDAAMKEAALLMPVALEASVDVYEFARAGVDGFSASLQDSLVTLSETATEGAEVNQQVMDAAANALGYGLACMGLVVGVASEVKAALLAYGAHRAGQLMPMVPLGTASSAVTGVQELLTRYAAHSAAHGVVDIVSGSLALAGTGPLGGIAGAGVKMLISVHTALENAHEAHLARKFLANNPDWFKQQINVMQAFRECPLLGAYFIQQCDSSDLIGYLTDASLFREELLQSQVESLIPRLELLRNLSNECQMLSLWGIEGLKGWQQNLDTRWYKQPGKFAYNNFQDFKKADVASIERRWGRAAGGAKFLASRAIAPG